MDTHTILPVVTLVPQPSSAAVISILGANTEFLKDRRLAVNFLKAFVEAQDFFTRNPDRAVDVIRRHATLDIRVDIRLPLMLPRRGRNSGSPRPT